MVDSCTLNDCNNYLLYGLGGGFLLSICANVIWSSYKNHSIRKQNSNYLQGFAPMPPASCYLEEWWLRRSGYVSVGQWLGLALGMHQEDMKKRSRMKAPEWSSWLAWGPGGKARKLASGGSQNETKLDPWAPRSVLGCCLEQR